MNYKTGWCLTAAPIEEKLFEKWRVDSRKEAIEKYKNLSTSVFDSYFELIGEKTIEKKGLDDSFDLLIINVNVKKQKKPKIMPVNAHLHSRIYTSDGFPLGEAVYVSENDEYSGTLNLIDDIFRKEYRWGTKILSNTVFKGSKIDDKIFEEFKNLQKRYLLCL